MRSWKWYWHFSVLWSHLVANLFLSSVLPFWCGWCEILQTIFLWVVNIWNLSCRCSNYIWYGVCRHKHFALKFCMTIGGVCSYSRSGRSFGTLCTIQEGWRWFLQVALCAEDPEPHPILASYDWKRKCPRQICFHLSTGGCSGVHILACSVVFDVFVI